MEESLMPPSPQPSPSPDELERPGTLLETDDDIRRALHAQQPAQPAARKTAPPPAPEPEQPAQRAGARSYRPTQRPPIALLTVLDDGKADGEVVRLRTDRFLIGRSEGDLLIPNDQQISARHLEITRLRVGDKYRWVVTDLQSANGLFIRVSRTVLSDKTEFLAGMGRYRFEAPSGSLPETVDHLPPETFPEGTRPPGNEGAVPLQPSLVELVGGKVTARLPLVKAEYWIGSDPACALCRAGDPFIEPRHVRLYREANGAWHAQNNKTANGLWLKVPQITVADSCSFQIGEQRFRLTAGG
jgi:pSer/pThr/pTyr-binding forkhead associated (FHA) protein